MLSVGGGGERSGERVVFVAVAKALAHQVMTLLLRPHLHRSWATVGKDLAATLPALLPSWIELIATQVSDERQTVSFGGRMVRTSQVRPWFHQSTA
jgi:hypothetical protein